MSSPGPLEDQSVWHDLLENEQFEIRSAMRVRRVARGETLIEQGSPSQTLFIVDFGLFEVRNADNTQIIAEIGKGQLIGEMGFFSGESRNASVVAARDSEVLEIDRSEFDKLAARFPEVQRAISRSLAKRLTRLAEIVHNSVDSRQRNPMRVVAVIRAGSGEMPRDFVEKLRGTITSRDRSRFLTSSDAETQFGCQHVDRYAIANWLADIERNHDLVICVADRALTDWTQTALRSADQLLMVADGSPDELNRVESFAFEIFPSSRRRLVRLHARRTGVAKSTAPWLWFRDVFMVHHVATEDEKDFDSLVRFLAGEAIGFVAGGGGAFGLAHVGVFKAFRESGITFDIHGGSSIGSAMAAAFSQLMEPDEIEAGIHEMLVRRRALKRLTLPLYGLLDHTVLDDALQQGYGSATIEDGWKPYFAVATDLSTYAMRVIRTGPTWQAVRASCAIPGVLPPFIDDEGHMLVDGGVVDNVPIAVMNSLKTGPNVVVDLRPLNHRIYNFSYQSIPGRWELLARMINPLLRQKLPRCPGPASVIQQSMFCDIRDKPNPANSQDLVLRPPAFPGSSLMNWDRHRDVLASAYQWGLWTVERLRAQGDPAFAAMERLSRAP
jgi:NTE family protein